jgi:hypothetical protein
VREFPKEASPLFLKVGRSTSGTYFVTGISFALTLDPMDTVKANDEKHQSANNPCERRFIPRLPRPKAKKNPLRGVLNFET